MDNHTSDGGAITHTGGAGEGNETHGDGASSGNANEPQISKADHDRAIRDLHKFKDRAREAADQVSALQAQIDDLKAQGLREKDDYKALYEQTKQKLTEAEQANERLKQNVIYSERYRAALPALQAAGLNADATKLLDYADLNELEVENQGGRFAVSGVELFVDKFKADHPYAFRTPTPANVNAGGVNPPPTRGPQKMTAERLFEIERECKAKGDMAPYKAAYHEFLKQRRAAQQAAGSV
jgi:hypothetical protein